MNEIKSIAFEIKDLDLGSRTAILAHAVYDNIDLTNDISRKGMFNKSWAESKSSIRFFLNHNDEQALGTVVDVYEDENKAYSKVKFGTHTLGEDGLKMADEGVASGVSFGYYTTRANKIQAKGRNVRELVEVKHIETSLLTKMAANPMAGVIAVTKSADLLLRLKKLESFIRNSKASDETIMQAAEEVKALYEILNNQDTAGTHDDAPPVSENVDELRLKLNLLNIKMSSLCQS